MSTQTDARTGLGGDVAMKVPCRAATTANITLSGLQTVDGVSLASDDRVLVKDQTDATENGVYLANTGSWVRAADFNGIRDVVRGTMVRIQEGSLWTGSSWEMIATGDVLFGTTGLSFAQILAPPPLSSGLQNLSLNPDFQEWSNRPVSEAVTSPGGGAGFRPHVLPEGWYGGPGTSSTYTFSRNRFTPGQTEIPGEPEFYGSLQWLSDPTGGSFEYTGVDRATFWEHDIGPLHTVMGKTLTVSFWARCTTGAVTIAPIMYASMGTIGWLTGQSKVVGDYVTSAHNGNDWVYQATSAGVTGGTAPTHLSGTVSDGGVNWLFLGKNKGRGYDIYEAGPGSNVGTVYATTAVGSPHEGATVVLGTTWQLVEKQITLPPQGYVNTNDYVSDVGDAVRTLLPPEDNLVFGGQIASTLFGLDYVGTPGTNTIDFANFNIERGAVRSEFRRWPFRLQHLASLEPKDRMVQDKVGVANLARYPSEITVTNTTSFVTVTQLTVPANYLRTDRKVTLSILGDLLKNASGEFVLVGEVDQGGVQSLGGTMSFVGLANSASRRSVSAVFEVAAKGSLSSQVGFSRVTVGDAGTSGAPGTGAGLTELIAMNNAVAVDSTQDFIIRVYARFDTASTSLSFTQRSSILELH